MTTMFESDVDTLNSLLRGELSAVDSYAAALTRFDRQPQEAALRRIYDDHRRAVALLHESVVEQGGDPSLSSGPWGYFTAAVTDTAKLLGPETTLAALKRGEEHGVQTYENTILHDRHADDCLHLILGRLLPQARTHLLTLESLMDAAS